uniref:Zinc-binding dehydrogenase n=1 Tax=OCS116 cluster bacterium TaxID=2030921 RepID=A0A2A4Z7E2_9PROT
MTDIATEMHAVIQLVDGYSGTAEGPIIDDAAEYVKDATIAVPKPQGKQVLIKMIASSVNPSDLHFIKGEYGQPRRKDVPAGFEGCGTVVALGDDASEALLGQRVAFAVSLDGSGTWADYALTNANTCVPLAPEVSDIDGAALIVNPLTAVAMVDLVIQHYEQQKGDAFVITAASSQLGKLMIGLGRDLGLKPIAVVRRADVVDNLKSLGAEQVLVTSDADFTTKMQDVMRTLKPRMMLDAVCDQISADMFTAMPAFTRWVGYGKLSPESPRIDQMGQMIFMNKKIEGFWLVNWMRDTPYEQKVKVFTQVQTRFATKKWSTDVVTKLPLKDIVSGLAAATKKTDGKIIITY